ncbi:MAG TPA: hypothetical protein VMT86_22480 [Bryobacteraceae bacterium]|nr:hypothetical protein [Bryobacteraceae bacterium]
MTFEESLQQLKERHDVLTQTVEIIAGMQRANERLHQQNEQRMAQMMDAITRLDDLPHDN